MGTRYLLDTNAAIYFLGGLLPHSAMLVIESDILAGYYAISVINRIELYSIQLTPADKTAIDNLTKHLVEMPLAEDVVQQTINLRHQYRIKLPDAVIAATCLCFNLELITRNIADFNRIGGLVVRDPYSF